MVVVGMAVAEACNKARMKLQLLTAIRSSWMKDWSCCGSPSGTKTMNQHKASKILSSFGESDKPSAIFVENLTKSRFR